MSADKNQTDVVETDSGLSLANELKQAEEDRAAAIEEQKKAADSANEANDRLKKATEVIKAIAAKQTVFDAVVKEYQALADTWPTFSDSLTASSAAAALIADAGMNQATKEQIPKLVKASSDKLDAAIKECRSAESALKKANEELVELLAKTDKAQATLDEAKQAPKQLAAELNVLKALQAEIATLRDKGQFTALHLCLLELNKRQSAVVVDKDKLASDLLGAMRELDALTAKVADKKREVEEWTQTIAAKKKAVDELKKDPRASLLAQLEGKAA